MCAKVSDSCERAAAELWIRKNRDPRGLRHYLSAVKQETLFGCRPGVEMPTVYAFSPAAARRLCSLLYATEESLEQARQTSEAPPLPTVGVTAPLPPRPQVASPFVPMRQPPQDKDSGQVVYCQVCRTWLNGPDQWQDREIGKKHKKNVKYTHDLARAQVPVSTDEDPEKLRADAPEWWPSSI